MLLSLRNYILLTICLGLVILNQSSVKCVSFEEDLTISYQQKLAIDKLRHRVQHYLTDDYMKTDIYLVKWLRSTNFDIRIAEKKIIENIRWRKEKRINSIASEDFTDVAEDYPFSSSGYDKEGRPLLIGFAGEWDIRAAVVTGRAPRVLRYMDQAMEILATRIRGLQREGKNVTQCVLIIDLGQFSVVTHACVQCLLRIVDFLYSYENHFPGLADKIFFTNAPPTVAFVLEMVRQNVSKETRDAIQVYGTNREQFQKVLSKYIDKKYLPVEFGGSFERN